ncbi:hypothetical protein ACJRO7_024406 [Eucalyptus globulus]|uniref:Uncharacterized protein n=1 Tax=Eucalyptus globulus TaxID=34317 RepID=A0ABD3KA08_EUCGL
MYFPELVYRHLEPDKGLQLRGINTPEEEETARKMIIVSIWCIQTNPSNRPSISKVIEMLEGSLDLLPIPPIPYLTSPPVSPNISKQPHRRHQCSSTARTRRWRNCDLGRKQNTYMATSIAK